MVDSGKVRAIGMFLKNGISVYEMSKILNLKRNLIDRIIEEASNHGSVQCIGVGGKTHVENLEVRDPEKPTLAKTNETALGRHQSYFDGIEEEDINLQPKYKYEELSPMEKSFYEKNKEPNT